MAYEVTLILGDGVGPELAEAAKMCIEAPESRSNGTSKKRVWM